MFLRINMENLLVDYYYLSFSKLVRCKTWKAMLLASLCKNAISAVNVSVTYHLFEARNCEILLLCFCSFILAYFLVVLHCALSHWVYFYTVRYFYSWWWECIYLKTPFYYIMIYSAVFGFTFLVNMHSYECTCLNYFKNYMTYEYHTMRIGLV